MAEEQAGFVEGKWTREQIVNIRIIIEKLRYQTMPCIGVSLIMRRHYFWLCKPGEAAWHDGQIGFPVHIVQMVANVYREQ